MTTDTLPKIGIVAEGIDTFITVLSRLTYFGVTIVDNDGGEAMGFLVGATYEDSDCFIELTEVDNDWEGTDRVLKFSVDDVSEVIVH